MKAYHQYCPVAHALDQIGDRWELLIVRELMLGQRRYTDLAEALPGIGSNILATRLRDLEAAGVVRKTKLPPPWAVTVYELTERGRELDSVLRSLAAWGAGTLGPPEAGDCWSMYAVHVRFRPEAAVDGTYEIRFCYYDRHGRFQRSPMILDAKDVRRMSEALKTAPKLKRLLSALAR